MKNHIYSKTIINRKYYRRTLTPRPILPTPLSKIPNLLSHETQHHLTYKTTLYSSRNFSFCKKERKKEKQQKPTAFSIPQPLHLAGKRWRDEETKREGKRRGQYSRRKEFDEREFSLPRRTHVQTPERILSYAGDPFHRARHGAPFGASVQRPWLLARGGANELRGSRFARNTWHLADATGCERDVGAILARKFEESFAEREGVNENVCR